MCLLHKNTQDHIGTVSEKSDLKVPIGTKNLFQFLLDSNQFIGFVSCRNEWFVFGYEGWGVCGGEGGPFD